MLERRRGRFGLLLKKWRRGGGNQMDLYPPFTLKKYLPSIQLTLTQQRDDNKKKSIVTGNTFLCMISISPINKNHTVFKKTFSNIAREIQRFILLTFLYFISSTYTTHFGH